MTFNLRPLAVALLVLAAAVPTLRPRARSRSRPSSAARSRRSSATTCCSNPELLQEVIQELEKRQAQADAEKHREAVKEHADAIFNSPRQVVARQSAGRRHHGRVLRLQLRLLQARAGRHDRADEGRSEAAGRAQGIPGARRRLDAGGAGRGRGAHAGQDRRQEVSRIPPEAVHQPRPDRQGARARGRQGDRPRHRAALEKDMASDEVKATLEESFKLAEALGINGTPTYVVGPRSWSARSASRSCAKRSTPPAAARPPADRCAGYAAIPTDRRPEAAAPASPLRMRCL